MSIFGYTANFRSDKKTTKLEGSTLRRKLRRTVTAIRPSHLTLCEVVFGPTLCHTMGSVVKFGYFARPPTKRV